MKEEVKAFKNELRNYRYYLKQKEILTDKKDLYFHSLTGMVGKGFDSQGGSTNESVKEEKRLETIDRINELEEKINKLDTKIDAIESVLNKVTKRVRKIMVGVYADGRTYLSYSTNENYSPRTLQQQVDKAIERALK